MLCAERATQIMGDVMHDALDYLRLCLKSVPISPFRRKDIEVQVAVANVSKTVDPEIADSRDGLAHPGNENRQST